MKVNLTIPKAWKITRVLLAVVVALILLSIVGQVSKYFFGHPKLKEFVPTFYVDYESNVPTWYSSIALLLCSAILAGITVVKWRAQDAFRHAWAFLSILFLALSIDEVAGIHEMPIESLRKTLGVSGLLYYTWVIPGAVFVGSVGLILAKFLFNLPKRTRNLMLLAGVVFVGGAICVEMVSGLHASQFGEENFGYSMIITVEELCEMLGVVIFIHALVDYVNRNFGTFVLTTELENTTS